jgi:hypothetical protein
MTHYSCRRMRKDTPKPSSPTIRGRGKIPLTVSTLVSGPSRSSNTKFFTRTDKTVCTTVSQHETELIRRNHLEFCNCKIFSKTRPRPVDKSQQVPMTLHFLSLPADALFSKPPVRLELLCIGSPDSNRAIDCRCWNRNKGALCYGYTFGHFPGRRAHRFAQGNNVICGSL